MVIINGGTNNANWGEDVDLAYQQMEDIILDIWKNMEDACIILSTLIATEAANGAINRIIINNDYRRLVRAYNGEKCIFLADMEPNGEGGEGHDFISLDGPYWADSPKVHPNVSFYLARNRCDKLTDLTERGA